MILGLTDRIFVYCNWRTVQVYWCGSHSVSGMGMSTYGWPWIEFNWRVNESEEIILRG